MAAIGALNSTLPRAQRFDSNDLVLSIDSLSRSYPLCQVMRALYANGSVALNSVAGESVDFALATVGVSPTVIISSSRTMSDYHRKVMKPHTGLVSSITHWFQARKLDAGNMPSHGLLSQVANMGPTSELSFDKLRLMCISHRCDADKDVRLTYEQLTDLRIFTGARIVYALTGPGVAGAVAQTNVFDYRRFDGASHFGSPLSSAEILLTGAADNQQDRVVEGQVSQSTFFQYLVVVTNLLRRLRLLVPLSFLKKPPSPLRDGSVQTTHLSWSFSGLVTSLSVLGYSNI